SLINQSMKLYKIAARPQLEFSDFKNIQKLSMFITENSIDKEVIEQAVIHLKYSGYIEKEKNNADKLNRLENVIIPSSFNYQKVKSLSYEAREKLSKIQPTSISQASRISGVSPSDISVLLVYMGR
ncbi:MAG: tRNA uridine-5-carboxymethylaminomethyl(34) synthesis enzyme MnmG, partial [Polaribacter sp.]|nr:tRNA uridine-5-carboxymethylaminomethyl(34) synthesis enzyme MnmG [Polaribacter sp.]